MDATTKKEGQDSVHCDGQCNAWIHRQCAGLSSSAFDVVRKSTSPFYCPHCRLDIQAKEINSLKVMISALTSDLSSIKSHPALSSSPSVSSISPVNTSPSYSSSVTNDRSSPPSQSQISNSVSTASDRKCNLVVYGIAECDKGTNRFDRLISDIDSVCQTAQSIVPSFDTRHVNDCIRLGKYSSDSSRSRPLLLKLNCASVAAELLKNRSKLPTDSNVFFKPHLSPSERHSESLLLKERRSLFEKGIDRKSVKLRGHKLFIGDRLHGQVLDGTFIEGHSLGDKAPILNPPSASSVSNPHSSQESTDHNLTPSVSNPHSSQESSDHHSASYVPTLQSSQIPSDPDPSTTNK